jgi:uncharacterized protein (TIGR00251 family)
MDSKNKPPSPTYPKSIGTKNGNCFIVVNAKPNSKESQVSGISDDCVDINIAAPPKDGEANAELIDFLSGVLGVKKSHISLERGSRARDKVIQVANYPLQQLYERLLDAMN